jgi:histidyl-tRNA synthetase
MNKEISNTDPYKGTRDFYPEEMSVRNFMWDRVSARLKLFAYQQVDGPMIEFTDLYKSKTGEEIVNEQTYSFVDRGGRDVTIRPEMTPTIARMIARKRKELKFPVRWFSIPNLYRYERPQKGRLREHWQLNVDAFGVEPVWGEVEMINIVWDIFVNGFGADATSFKIKLNHRQLTDYILAVHFALDKEKAHQMQKMLDRMCKVPKEEFEDFVEEYIGNRKQEFLDCLAVRSLEDLQKVLGKSAEGKIIGLDELQKTFEVLRSMGIDNIAFDMGLMRGFDYYTGIVFEVYDLESSHHRSLCGGGRYDHLVDIFGVESVGAVGFGLGDVTLEEFLRIRELCPDPKQSIEVYIGALEEKYLSEVAKIGKSLRESGVSVYTETSISKPAKYAIEATKRQAKFLVVIGQREIESGEILLKNLETRSEERVKIQDLGKEIRKRD